MPSPTCPKCQTEMQVGFIPDSTHYTGNYVRESHWAAGLPERSFWTGLKVHSRDQKLILTYRCPACGYLESYAR